MLRRIPYPAVGGFFALFLLVVGGCTETGAQSTCTAGHGAFGEVCCKESDCATGGACHEGVCTRACGADAGCAGLVPDGGTTPLCSAGFCETPTGSTSGGQGW